MEELLKKRVKKYIITSIVLIIISPLLVVAALVIVEGDISTIINMVSPVQHIEVGADLKLYEGKKVSCSVRNIVEHVVGVYDDESTKENYTEAYLVVDDNFEHPTLVFFPESKYEQLEDMRNRTQNVMDGELEIILPIEIKGYVHKLKDSFVHFYVKSMNDVYGEGTADNIKNVYYIDDESAFSSKEKDIWIIILIATLSMEVIMVSILFMAVVQAIKYPKMIENFLLENNMLKADLESEFIYAEELDINFWISNRLTIGFDGVNFIILNNANIERIKVRKIPGRKIIYSFKFYSKEYDKCSKLLITNKSKVVDYYSVNCPHIMIG